MAVQGVPGVSDDDLMYEYNRDGLIFEVFRDRIDVTQKKKHQTIPMSSVSEVTVVGRLKVLKITTTDGKEYQYQLGRSGEEARGAIASASRV